MGNIQIINDVDTSIVDAAELEPCIEELDQRLTENDIEEVLDIIGGELGREPEEEEEGDAVGGEVEAEDMVVDG